MRVSYIIMVYKDVEALSVIVNSLFAQSVLPHQIVIAEDGNCEAMRAFVATLSHPTITITHTFHEDTGWRKNASANNAVRASIGDYLIFNDGDCIPYPQVVENHIKMAKERTIVCGRRVNLGEGFSRRLRDKVIDIATFSKTYLLNLFSLKQDGTEQYEEGLFISPTSWLGRWLKAKRDSKATLLGCCWGVHKSDLEAINGFDEDFTFPTGGCDTDVERRFRALGYAFASCRNHAIVAHLYHKEKYSKEDDLRSDAMIASKLDTIICKNGLDKR